MWRWAVAAAVLMGVAAWVGVCMCVCMQVGASVRIAPTVSQPSAQSWSPSEIFLPPHPCMPSYNELG